MASKLCLLTFFSELLLPVDTRYLKYPCVHFNLSTLRLTVSTICCGSEAVMLSQPVWDQMLESEKKKVQSLEESYAERMRSHSVGV